MEVVIGIGDEDWRCSIALAYLFFEEEDTAAIAELIARHLKRRDLDSNISTAKTNDVGWERISQLRAAGLMPDPSLKRSPILWLRFGFLSQSKGIPLSDRFLRTYARWRKQSSREFGGAIVRLTLGDSGSGGAVELLECHLDYFLYASRLGIDISSDVTIELIYDYPDGDTVKVNNDKRTTAEHVGRHAQSVIGQFVAVAAVRGSIKGLTPGKDGSRYVCHLTRQELAEALHAKFPDVQEYCVSTVFRAIGDFVACSRPRRG